MGYYRFSQVKEITGLSRSTIFRLERDGAFPARRKISRRNVAWLANDIGEWLLSREMVAIGDGHA